MIGARRQRATHEPGWLTRGDRRDPLAASPPIRPGAGDRAARRAAGARPGAAQAKQSYPFQDPQLAVEKRVDDLLGRLTLDEKLSLLHQSQVAIPRLGIPYFKAGTEALHGVAWSNDINNNWNQVLADKATVFPQAVGLASTWNPSLVKKVGSAVGDEARAYNSIDPTLWGLQVWAPVVNLLRDPRWGRNEEGYSEDPFLTGAISTSYGRGLQGDDPTYLKTAPVLKHFYAYNNETNRSGSSSNVTPRVRHEYDYAAFKPAIEADAATGVMASYNMVNGRPTHVDREINEAVRSWTDKTLYNVTDAWGPHAVTQAQFYYDTEDEAYANVLKAGNDSFTVDNYDNAPMKATLKSALDKGLLTVADIDKAVRHTLTIRTRLGHFDPDGGPYAKIKPDVLNSPAHKELNRQAADEATVLLRNSEGTLPLDPAKTKKVAVVGPLQDTLFTDWYGATLPYEVTPLDGIKERLGAGADVTGVDAIDRVAFKDNATGKYLTATGTTRREQRRRDRHQPDARLAVGRHRLDGRRLHPAQRGQQEAAHRQLRPVQHLIRQPHRLVRPAAVPPGEAGRRQLPSAVRRVRDERELVVDPRPLRHRRSRRHGRDRHQGAGRALHQGRRHRRDRRRGEGRDRCRRSRRRGRQQPVRVRPGEPRPDEHCPQREPAGAHRGGPEGQPEDGRRPREQLPDHDGQAAEVAALDHARRVGDRARRRGHGLRRPQPLRAAHPDLVPVRRRPAARPLQLRHHQHRADLPLLQEGARCTRSATACRTARSRTPT